ncbi:DUF1254 domain-containing protein [Metapseudomonas resinovorans]|uniref:DUF1254 domain-containing protein n=1 Tax=Metapseudomonas resinovorans NBRC 106553 TaxID=1245471 RepID=S6AN29_METRE|nr:DUF1254 domain-containing protein [Pseudomonas resinovorans]BAN46963.1 hypothetical protein PCA10_12310 [Pseudomonas resinovorans NBRC 106553]
MPSLRRTALALSLCLLGVTAQAADTEQDLIREAFHYSYPLYKLSDYRWTALNDPGARTATEVNRFAHSRAITTSADRWANSPIVDALYSTAWIDLANGPVTLHTPDTGKRYYVLTLIDFYSNTFFYAGTRATGTAAQALWLVGPDWRGDAPAGTRLVRAPTNDLYLNLRVLVDGQADLAAAHGVQDGFRIVLAQAAAPAPTRPQPLRDDAERYLQVVNQMLALDPPPADQAPLLERFARVGICGSACSWEALPEAQKQAWRGALPKLQAGFMQAYLKMGAANGWIDYSPPGNLLGTDRQRDFTQRAYALAIGMGMLGLRREEANYWITLRDEHGQPLRGDGRYRLHLPAGGVPSEAFWSVSLYTAAQDGQFLYPNPLNRHHLGSRTGLVPNADGSLDLFIQPEQPAERPGNWLPTPADGQPFQLFVRAYIPARDVLAGTFRMPPVRRVD